MRKVAWSSVLLAALVAALALGLAGSLAAADVIPLSPWGLADSPRAAAGLVVYGFWVDMEPWGDLRLFVDSSDTPLHDPVEELHRPILTDTDGRFIAATHQYWTGAGSAYRWTPTLYSRAGLIWEGPSCSKNTRPLLLSGGRAVWWDQVRQELLVLQDGDTNVLWTPPDGYALDSSGSPYDAAGDIALVWAMPTGAERPYGYTPLWAVTSSGVVYLGDTGGTTTAKTDGEWVVWPVYPDGGIWAWDRERTFRVSEMTADLLAVDGGTIAWWSHPAGRQSEVWVWQSGGAKRVATIPDDRATSYLYLDNGTVVWGEWLGYNDHYVPFWSLYAWRGSSVVALTESLPAIPTCFEDGVLVGREWDPLDPGRNRVVRFTLDGDVVPWSPYPAGEWTHQFKGQLHAHYMAEHAGNVGSNCMGLNFIDGLPLAPSLTPESLIGLYGLAGYDFVAVTEHYGNNQYEEDEHIWDQTPTKGETGVWHIWDSMEDTPHPTDEIEGTAKAGHLLGIGFDREEAGLPDWTEGAGAPDSNQMTPRTRVFRIQSQEMGGGMAIVAHPNVHKYRWTAADILDSRPRGVEIYNAGSDIANLLFGWWSESNDPLALNTWDEVLRSGGTVWGTAGDDFTVPWPQFDGGYVMAVCDTADPSKDDIMWALKQGSFYACEALSPRYDAPRIEGYWYDGEGETIHLLLGDDGYRVRFITAKGLDPTPPDVVQAGDYWDYQYLVASDDRYVRAEVKDGVGNISWTQPIFFDRPASEIETWFGASAPGELGAASEPPLAVDVADAHLEVSTPQSQIQHVYGRTLGIFERPEALPPMGYVGECYEFLPEAILDGVNTLTIAYEDGDAQLVPESALAIYWYDETEETWLALATSVDDGLNSATAGIDQLGIYALSGEITEDETAPVVTIDSPPDGSSQSGVITISASAADDNGVASVRFFLDEIPLGHDSYGADGWTQEVDLSVYPPGSHVITAKAEDASGNSAQDSVSITSASPAPTPGIAIASPGTGASYWIWEEVEVSGTWSDDDPLVLGLTAVDEAPLSTFSDEGIGEWQVTLALGPGMEGERQLRAIGLDAHENRAEASQPITLRFFSDVPREHWAYLDIYHTAKASIVQGYPDGTYQPDAAVTRGQMAIYISRALAGGDEHVPSGPAQASFTDVPSDDICYKYIEYAHANQIVFGYQDGCYWPGYEVDRGTMAVFVARATATPVGEPGMVGYVPPVTPTFADVTPDPPDPYQACHRYVEYIAEQGIVHGYEDFLYHPEYVVSRGLMAIYVARAFGLG